MTEPLPVPAAPVDRFPVGRAVIAGMLLRRFGLLPLVALALAGRNLSPARRRLVLTAAAAVYLGASALLLLLVVVLVVLLAVLALAG